MSSIWIYQVTPSGEITFHHVSSNSYESSIHALKAGLMILKVIHNTTKVPISLMQMYNHQVKRDKEDVKGVLLLSADIPWACFVPKAELESDTPHVYSSTIELLKTIEIPEC